MLEHLRLPTLPALFRPLTACVALCLISACSESPGQRVDGGIRLDAARDAAIDRQTFERLPDLLLASDQRPAAADRCGGGGFLVPVGGKLTVQGTTSSGSNQYGSAIRCGGDKAFTAPQRYYAIELDEDATYRFSLAPGFPAVLYLMSACSEDIINADCSSSGATGALLGPVAAQGSGSLIFRPPATGTYELAVDGVDPADSGAFSLTVEVFTAPAEARCSTPKLLTLQGGVVKTSGTTFAAKNDFADVINCGLGLGFDGPQVYHAVDLVDGETYRLTLEPQFEASLIVFGEGAGCQPDDINQDCSTLLGSVMPSVPAQGKRSTLFTARQNGRYLIAVDAAQPTQAGSFALTIEQVTIADNRVCDEAQAVALTAGTAVIQGDTAGSENDLGAHLFCGGPRLVGPQRYYSLQLEAKPYQLSLSAAFDATLVVGAACNTLPIDCASAGLSGATLSVGAQKKGVVSFTPASPGSYLLAVDSDDGGASGAFRLELRESSPPQNGVCASPQALTLTSGVASTSGDTGLAKNDLVSISCGSPQGPFAGPQTYYSVQLPPNSTAQVDLSPEPLFDAALYAFEASAGCSSAAVGAACTGLVSDAVGVGIAESINLDNPTGAAKTFVIAVDSWSPSEVGSYLLEVTVL
jgi:tellurite resistance-related uncharacterized protein